MSDHHHIEKAQIGRNRRLSLSVEKRMAKKGMLRCRAIEAARRHDRFVREVQSKRPDDAPYR